MNLFPPSSFDATKSHDSKVMIVTDSKNVITLAAGTILYAPPLTNTYKI